MQHAEEVVVIPGEDDELMVRQGCLGQPYEQPVLGDVRCTYESREAGQPSAHVNAWTLMKPPLIPRASRRVTLRLHMLQYILERSLEESGLAYRHVGAQV